MPKILIAEDNELNLKLMFDILSSQRYEIETAFDGESALEKLLNNHYDLLLLDLQMPKLTGFEVLEKIKEQNIKIKTIVVSACAMNAEIKIWILLAVAGVMAAILGFIIKLVTAEVIKRLDDIVNELKQLSKTTTIQGQQIQGLLEQDAAMHNRLNEHSMRLRVLEHK